MKYIVREPGKSGGREFDNATAAVDAALDWHAMTGIVCELWVSHKPERDTEYEFHDDELEEYRKIPNFLTFARERFGYGL